MITAHIHRLIAVARAIGLDPADGVVLTNPDSGHWRLMDATGAWRSFTASYSLAGGEAGYLPGLELAKEDSRVALELIAQKVKA